MLTAWDRSRYPLRRLQTPRDEASMQAGVLALLERRGIMAWPVDAGGARLRGRVVAAAKRRGIADMGRLLHGATGGAVAGLPDVLGVTDGGRMVAVEVKRPEWIELRDGAVRQVRAAGHLRPEQEAFLRRLESRGALVCVAWDESDVERLLDGEGR